MLKKIAIYGAGGFGREIRCLLNEINEISQTWDFVGFFDDKIAAGTTIKDGKVLGGIDALNSWENPLDLILAFGNPIYMKEVFTKIKNPSISFPNIISPKARFLEKSSLKIGKGNLINWNCSISCDVEIGDFNLLNLGVAIGHDSKLGNFNVLMTNVNISGNVQLGNENFVGTGATILQGIRLGNATRIGGNALVIKNTEENSTYIGNPAVKFHF